MLAGHRVKCRRLTEGFGNSKILDEANKVCAIRARAHVLVMRTYNSCESDKAVCLLWQVWDPRPAGALKANPESHEEQSTQVRSHKVPPEPEATVGVPLGQIHEMTTAEGRKSSWEEIEIFLATEGGSDSSENQCGLQIRPYLLSDYCAAIRFTRLAILCIHCELQSPV
eukprot:g27997.t1